MVCSHNFHCWCRERVEKISWIWRRQLNSEAGQCEMKWSFSKLQVREGGMNNHGFSVFCCNTGAMFLQAQARAEQCESWILSQEKRRRHESWQVCIFIWFSMALQHTSRLGNVRLNGAFPNYKWEKAWILTISGWFVAMQAQSNKHKGVHTPPTRMLLQPELIYDHQIPELQQRKRTHSTDTHLSFSALINQVYVTIVLPHHKPRMQYPSYLALKENTIHKSPAKL
jgi:hypothetical protein